MPMESSKRPPVVQEVSEQYAPLRLTNAETRLAVGLLTGKSLDSLGREWQLSRETLKTQLRSLFRKTGTHRQSELIVRLIGLLNRSTKASEDRQGLENQYF